MLTFTLTVDNGDANDLEEFKAVLEVYTNACKNLDAEAMVEIEAEAIGFSQSGQMNPIGGELETIQGRQSVTYLKTDGQWKMVLYHRDIPINK